ncbi:hypothetical protein O6H91_Y581200 [Diphasiastrum complanatum]|nr:hypothetical protein O6H91_Y581200 [Diphasiastrum complanatum]
MMQSQRNEFEYIEDKKKGQHYLAQSQYSRKNENSKCLNLRGCQSETSKPNPCRNSPWYLAYIGGHVVFNIGRCNFHRCGTKSKTCALTFKKISYAELLTAG